jgi:PAS domain S-box-containing protein
MTGLLLLSVALQFIAAALALRLFFITNRKVAWLLISSAILLMAVRRSITLGRILAGPSDLPPDLVAEGVALVISLLMVVGIYWIGPLFAALKKSEEESREEVSDLKSTYEAFPDLIFRLAPDGTFLKYHVLDREELYIPPEEFLGKRPSDVLPEEVVQKLEGAIAELENGKPESTYEYRLPSPKGLLNFEARVSRLSNGDIRIIARNVSDRKALEEELDESVRRFRALFEQSQLPTIRFRPDGSILQLNRATKDLWGLSPESEAFLLGSYDILEDDHLRDSGLQPSIRQAFAGQTTRISLQYFKPKFLPEMPYEGEPPGRWIQAILSPIEDEQGNLLEVLLTHEDLTDRMETQRAFLASEERYKAIFENAAVGVALAESDGGKFITANGKFCEIFGIAAEEVPNLTMSDFTPAEDATGDLETVKQVLNARETVRFKSEKRYLRRDGTPLWTDVGLTFIWGDGPEKDVHVIVVEDVTARKTAEISRRQSEDRYRAVFEQANVGVAVLATNGGKILQANDKLCRILGVNRDDLVGGTMLRFIPPTDLEKNYRLIERLIERKEISVQFENIRYLRADGLEVWMNCALSFLWGDDPENDLHICVFEDVTTRKIAQDAVRDSEKRYRAVFENAAVGVALLDTHSGRILQANHKFCDIFGYALQEIHGKTILDFSHPDYVEANLKTVQALIENRESQAFENERRFVRKDGSFGWGEYSLSFIWGEDGEPDLHILIVHDVTEAKRAAEDRARLGTAIEQACELVAIADESLRIQYVNPTFTRVTGYTLGEVAGRRPDDFILDPNRNTSVHRAFKKSLGRGDIWRGQIVAARKSGESALIDLTVSPVRDGTGKTANYVYIGRDITRENELEILLRQAQKMEAVGQLAGGIAHDFNNILQAIQGYTDITRQDLAPGSEARSNLDEVSKASQRASALVRQLLTFSRRDRREPKIVDLNESISGLIKMLRRVIGEQIDLNLHLVPKLKSIYADPGQVEQILMNLCVNARDAMPEGGSISIETQNAVFEASFLETFAWAREGDYVRLRVADTGSGIPNEFLDRVFEPFFTTKEVGKGTGLGLATVYGIVKQHEGHIDVQSEPGKGTVFTIYLPAEKTAGEREEAESLRRPALGGNETILVAEDDTLVRNLAVQILERAGYEVMIARDGEEALDLFTRHADRIDLALLDMVMPKKNGNAIYERIRRRRPDLPVLFSSGYSFGALDADIETGDRVDRIQKPFEPDIMLRKTRDLLDSARSTPA